MQSRKREYTERLERELARHAIQSYRFEKRRKHTALIVSLGCGTRTVIFSETGSDWRGPMRAVCDLRHALGVVGRPKANDNKHASIKRDKAAIKRPAKRLPLPKVAAESFRVDHYYSPLAQLAAQMRAQTANDNGGHCGSPKRIRLLTPFFGAHLRYATVDSLMVA